MRIPAVFRLLQTLGELEERHMFNTFNMGVGMTITLPGAQVDRAIALLGEAGVTAYPIGEVVSGGEGVALC
ncbi:Phosphoribosylformylglycinamidine cyclo-ligase [bioreactor metagenome]|uniref:phosphoribosylformylglycinamidine cyclo-ligase n=1 Tax=bioreactor metagenome TaxID=1076179 RepID=A0A645DFI8_9ZZZZ